MKYPDAFRRRLHSGPFAETRMVQKIITVGIILTVVAVAVVSAFDHRFGWSTVPTPIVVVGLVLVVVGLGLAEAVVVQNNFAAATITVEAEQQVVSTGLLRRRPPPDVCRGADHDDRHAAGARLVLGSAGCSSLGVLILAARITDEEKALHQDLDGYDDYTETVHYRPIPGCGDHEDSCPGGSDVSRRSGRIGLLVLCPQALGRSWNPRH